MNTKKETPKKEFMEFDNSLCQNGDFFHKKKPSLLSPEKLNTLLVFSIYFFFDEVANVLPIINFLLQ